jgi:hypothetical protein
MAHTRKKPLPAGARPWVSHRSRIWPLPSLCRVFQSQPAALRFSGLCFSNATCATRCLICSTFRILSLVFTLHHQHLSSSSRCLCRRRGFFVAHEGYFRAPVTSKYNFMATCNNRCDVRFEIRPRFISSSSPPMHPPPPSLFDSIFLSPIRVQSNVFPTDFPHPSLLHDFACVVLSAVTFRRDCNRGVLCSFGLERIPAI